MRDNILWDRAAQAEIWRPGAISGGRRYFWVTSTLSEAQKSGPSGKPFASRGDLRRP